MKNIISFLVMMLVLLKHPHVYSFFCTDLKTEPYKVTLDEGMIKVEVKGILVWSKALETEDGDPSTGRLATTPARDSSGNVYISYQVVNKKAWPWYTGLYQNGSTRFIPRESPYFPAYEHRVAKINPNQSDFIWNVRIKELEFDSRINPIFGKPEMEIVKSTVSESLPSGRNVFYASHQHDIFAISQYPALGNGDNVDRRKSEIVVNAGTGELIDHRLTTMSGDGGGLPLKDSASRNKLLETFLDGDSVVSLLERNQLKLPIYENYQDKVYTYTKESAHYILGNFTTIQSDKGIVSGWLVEALVSINRQFNTLSDYTVVHISFDKEGKAKALFQINSGHSSFNSIELFFNTLRFSDDGKFMYGSVAVLGYLTRPDLATVYGWDLATGSKLWENNDFYIGSDYYGRGIFYGGKTLKKGLPAGIVKLKDNKADILKTVSRFFVNQTFDAII